MLYIFKFWEAKEFYIAGEQLSLLLGEKLKENNLT